MTKNNPCNPQKMRPSTDLIPAIKYRYLIDFRTLTRRTSKMPMQVIIDRFLRSKQSFLYKLTAYEKLIIFILASYMGNKSNCWPSYDSLEIDCSLSKSTLIRNIKSLEMKQVIKIIRNKNTNNIYEFYPQVVSIGHLVISNGHHQVSNRHPNNITNNNINNNDILYKKPKELKCTVPDWGIGHPTYDAIYEIN